MAATNKSLAQSDKSHTGAPISRRHFLDEPVVGSDEQIFGAD
jgi:hypothetical protein